ncbi:MAG: hypothetical protein GC164_01170 [Phycisphaera sp.]|nr:hypothetical protein [Phycisphaera sp.]
MNADEKAQDREAGRSTTAESGRAKRAAVGQALTFLGPLVFAGGMLAIWRTGEKSVFYALLALVGLLIWLAGFWLVYRGKHSQET